MMLIFAPKATQRHDFVFRHIFDYLGLPFSITSDLNEFQNSGEMKFSYAGAPLAGELHFSASGFLDEKEIKNFIPETGEFKAVTTLFPCINSISTLPYDIFSAVFYMLSRYEEYLPFVPDEYGRFEAMQSLAYKKGFLEIPVVDIWIKQLSDAIKSVYPAFVPKEKKIRFTPTYDIDNAFAYKYKGCLRTTGAFLKDSATFRCNSFFTRLNVLAKRRPDPFDTYDYLFKLQERYSLQPAYFFHPGTYGKYDKNCSLENKNIQKLIKAISAKADLGIHPSYRSTEEPGLLASEIEKLEKVFGKKITKARQHFIRIRMPDTYRQYIACGISDDYSMGFATEAGFRAGTSEPFHFFDLEKNEETRLIMHPFVFMDGVFIQYHPSTPAEIMEKLLPIINSVKETNGSFVSLFHNNAFCDTYEMRHWRGFYENLLVLMIK